MDFLLEALTNWLKEMLVSGIMSNLSGLSLIHISCTFCGKEAMKMQEEVENRTLTLVVSGTKFTGRLLKAAISKYMAHCKEKKLQKKRSRDAPVTPHGKQTVKQDVYKRQLLKITALA